MVENSRKNAAFNLPSVTKFLKFAEITENYQKKK